MARERKPRSTTAALVEGRSSVADEEHPDRLPIEETWPTESGKRVPLAELEEDGTVVSDCDPTVIPRESTAHPDNQQPYLNQRGDAIGRDDEVPMSRAELGLSNAGPFIAPAASLISELTPEQRKEAEAALDKRFEAFSEALYKACYTHGFLIYPQAAQDMGPERSRLKRSRRVATALASMVCVLASPEPKR